MTPDSNRTLTPTEHCFKCCTGNYLLMEIKGVNLGRDMEQCSGEPGITRGEILHSSMVLLPQTPVSSPASSLATPLRALGSHMDTQLQDRGSTAKATGRLKL